MSQDRGSVAADVRNVLAVSGGPLATITPVAHDDPSFARIRAAQVALFSAHLRLESNFPRLEPNDREAFDKRTYCDHFPSAFKDAESDVAALSDALKGLTQKLQAAHPYDPPANGIELAQPSAPIPAQQTIRGLAMPRPMLGGQTPQTQSMPLKPQFSQLGVPHGGTLSPAVQQAPSESRRDGTGQPQMASGKSAPQQQQQLRGAPSQLGPLPTGAAAAIGALNRPAGPTSMAPGALTGGLRGGPVGSSGASAPGAGPRYR